MGADKKTVKVVVEATNNEFTLASGELIAKTRDVLLDRRRSDIASTTWAMLSEGDQEREVDALTTFAEDLVHGIVEVVAAGNFDVIHAQLDNFKSKDGEVTVTAKGRSSDGALIALNRIGHKHLKIIVADEEQFDKHRDTVPIDVDQPEMFGDDEGGQDDVLDPETGELTSSDETTNAIVDKFSAGELDDAKQLGIDGYDEDQDPEQNPYGEDEEELRTAWFNGFYERKNEQIEDPDPFKQGLETRENELHLDQNPYDADTESHDLWIDGFNSADKQLNDLEADGYEDASNGKGIDDSGWKKGSSADKYWRKGFERYHADVRGEVAEDSPE